MVLYGKYQILRLLGRNTTCEVFLAEHMALHSYRVLKRLRKADPLYGALKEEAGILKNLKHPCIPALYDVLEDEEYLVLVEQYMEGETLKAVCERGEGLSEGQILEIAVQLCDIIQFLHTSKNGLLYLDLKPENLLWTGEILSLVDFGSAVPIEKSAERRYGFGTPEFAAPELLKGETVSEYTDIYGIGRVIAYLWESVYAEHRTKKREAAMKQVITISTHPIPQERYPDVAKLKHDLLHIFAKCRRRKPDDQRKTEGDILESKQIYSQTQEKQADNWKGGHKGQPEKKRIGVYGIHRMAGCTQIALRIALFLKRRGGKQTRVAFLEMSGREDMCRLEDWYFGEDSRNLGESFTIRGVDVWKTVNEEKALQLYNCGYDYLVLDLGSGERGRKELLRCREKLVIGSGLPWHVKDWSEYFRGLNGMGRTKDWHYLYSAGGEKGLFTRLDGITFYELPQMTSLWKGTKEEDALFSKILG